MYVRFYFLCPCRPIYQTKLSQSEYTVPSLFSICLVFSSFYYTPVPLIPNNHNIHLVDLNVGSIKFPWDRDVKTIWFCSLYSLSLWQIPLWILYIHPAYTFFFFIIIFDLLIYGVYQLSELFIILSAGGKEEENWIPTYISSTMFTNLKEIYCI